MKYADIVYMNQGMFTAFIPESRSGENAFREICVKTGDHTGKVLSIHARSTIAQLKAAGYTVAKAKPANLTGDELDALLASLSQ